MVGRRGRRPPPPPAEGGGGRGRACEGSSRSAGTVWLPLRARKGLRDLASEQLRRPPVSRRRREGRGTSRVPADFGFVAGRATFGKELRPLNVPKMALAGADGGKGLVVTLDAALSKEEKGTRWNGGG